MRLLVDMCHGERGVTAGYDCLVSKFAEFIEISFATEVEWVKLHMGQVYFM